MGHKFTSWKSNSDPSPGLYTFEIMSNGELHFKWNGSVIYYNSGPWDGAHYTNPPQLGRTTPPDVFHYDNSTGSPRVWYVRIIPRLFNPAHLHCKKRGNQIESSPQKFDIALERDAVIFIHELNGNRNHPYNTKRVTSFRNIRQVIRRFRVMESVPKWTISREAGVVLEICRYTTAGRSVTADISLKRMRLDPDGVARQQIWVIGMNSWQTFISAPMEPCDAYRVCGQNSLCKSSNYIPGCSCFPDYQPVSAAEWNVQDYWLHGCSQQPLLQCANGTNTDTSFMAMSDSTTIEGDTQALVHNNTSQCIECSKSCSILTEGLGWCRCTSMKLRVHVEKSACKTALAVGTPSRQGCLRPPTAHCTHLRQLYTTRGHPMSR